MLYSHPDKGLIDHLKNVCNIGLNIYCKEKINFEIEDKLVFRTIKNTLLLHDFGKATPYFQNYLFCKKNNKEYNGETELKNHSLISALYASYKTKIDTENDLLSLICFSSVLKHHGDLENWDDIFFIDDKKIKILEKQYISIDFNELKEINLVNFNWKELRDYLENLWCIKQDTKIDFKYFFFLKYIYSILIYSDKNETIFSQNFYDVRLQNESIDFIHNYKKEKFKDSDQENILNKLKDQFFKKAIKKINENESTPDIVFINIPTGLGKTLTGLQIALEMLKKDRTLKKIIYAVPVMSIIDQNEEIINEIFKINGQEPKEYFMKHHHLVEPKIKIDENYFEGNKGQFLVENWDKPLILTTFWQIFNTIFSGDNKLNRKFHNFVGSLIILDEIQTIPIKYWKIINETLQFFIKKMNCKIIYMTATMPSIFTQQEIKNNIVINFDDIDNFQRDSINRYQIGIINELNPIEQDDIFLHINDEIKKNKNKNFLFVLNTIKESIIFYQKIKEIKDSADDIYYLSSNIIPKDRKRIINELKEKLKQHNDKRIILISTQLIEAGIDLDFDIVYRDFAPLDSIVQTAGRCNRNNREKGIIFLFNLKDEKNRCFYSYIYDKLSIIPTEEFFKKQKSVSEEKLFHNLDSYYNSVQKRMKNDAYINLKQNIEKLQFKDVQENFKIIEEMPTMLVFIEKDDEASNLLTKYQKIQKSSLYERKNEFLKIKNNFYEYILTVNITLKNSTVLINFDKIDNFLVVSKKKLNSFYNEEFGFTIDFNPFF
ncbi:MAG: CRISPR-associated helicase Cas3' [bacterium]|nr:CRISPR-associated helicase Cas3' [bacterium]